MDSTRKLACWQLQLSALKLEVNTAQEISNKPLTRCGLWEPMGRTNCLLVTTFLYCASSPQATQKGRVVIYVILQNNNAKSDKQGVGLAKLYVLSMETGENDEERRITAQELINELLNDSY